jgi:hypothetical protein
LRLNGGKTRFPKEKRKGFKWMRKVTL